VVSVPANPPGDGPGRIPRDRLRRGLLALFLAGEAAAVMALGVSATVSARSAGEQRGVQRALVLRLRLSGLALWSEASYCRQPALSDVFSPHAVHPASPDLFPAGSMVPPHPSVRSSGRGRGGRGGGP